MELTYCTIPLIGLVTLLVAGPFIAMWANREVSKPTPPPEPPKEESPHKVNLAKPLRRFAHIGGGLTVAASVLLLIGFAYQNVTFIPCGEEDSISRAVKGTQAEAVVASIPNPCGCEDGR